jgi:putative oxygen-independent coproporphyrinogen III oxidase
VTITQLPPLSLYIHIPWCLRKCPYCDFNSHTTAVIPEADYAKALIADLDQDLLHVQNRPLQSIFFGGGTPSLFSAKIIGFILSEVEKRITFSSDIEITLEANPGTTEQSKFSGYRSAGVNRLSIGIQSFNSSHLNLLGRVHDGDEALNAFFTATKAGFDNINLDLMHGLPEQTPAQGLADLRKATELEPKHISWYQLTIEPNTAFYSSPPILPSDDQLADIQQAGEQLLAEKGYQQYEISAYCQPDRQSRHNSNYWLFGDYLGIGAGAHGKITSLSTNIIHRRWKTRSPRDYLATGNKFLAGEKAIAAEDLPLEFMMNSLRLTGGFDQHFFKQRTGLEFTAIKKTIDKLVTEGLLDCGNNIIKPSTTGKRFLNTLLMEF